MDGGLCPTRIRYRNRKLYVHGTTREEFAISMDNIPLMYTGLALLLFSASSALN